MIVPFVYKPGILRDGSIFQSDYCTDGQWIRFVGGRIKKMKGQREVEVPFSNGIPAGVANIVHIDLQQTNDVTIYFASYNRIDKGLFDTLTTTVTKRKTILNEPDNDNTTAWVSVRFVKNTRAAIAFLKLQNGVNLNSKTPGILYWKYIGDNTVLTAVQIPPSATGGILFSNPSLFLYGENGIMMSSRTSDPLKFDPGVEANEAEGTEASDAIEHKAGDSKILFAASVRGGTNSPSFLLWNASSVMYLSNVADGETPNTPIDFQIETVTTDSNLMSSRSVVQSGSLFFWLGTDRMFNYNGISDKVPNVINLESILDNVDMNKRQKVFGYQVARYDEIRWAYPEIANAADPDIGCTREVVYNYKENTWYDTVIRRDCVAVFPSTGEVFTYGEAASNFPFSNDPNDSYKRIWKHETDWTERREGGVNVNIPSSFTTPFYGLVTFNPDKSGNVIDKYIVLDRIEPDFPTNVPRTDADVMTITPYYKKYASTALVASPARDFYLGDSEATPNLGKVDFRGSGRFLSIKFECSFPFDVGTTLFHFKEGDGQ